MPQEAQKPLISFRNVEVRKEAGILLHGVSLTVMPGEFVYVVGRVGSGKTSLIRTLIGEFPVAAGEARVVDYDLRTLRPRQIPYLRRKMGVVFQDFKLLMDRTVYENLAFVLRATGWRKEALMRARIEEVLTKVGMQKKQYKLPHQLSGGEQQRVAIARALLNRPALILADEPTGNLDSDTQEEIMRVLMEVYHSQGPAVLMVTHNKTLLEQYPGRILRFERGCCQEVTLREEIDLSQFMNL